jgi:2-polyprenyl-3-methyl-5-hydroxy-6-metoxy-1,4-benzoquinol methylase
VRSGAKAARHCPGCRNDFGAVVWREAGHRYLRCSTCGLVFADLTLETYRATQYNAWNEEELAPEVSAFYGDARNHAHALFLERHPPSGAGRLLDVGCGFGYFLAHALAAGWEVTGCEPSPSWSDRARLRLGADRVVTGAADDPALDGSTFDLITAWDVIEHVFDPLPFLARLRELLAPGGHVFLRTPNLAYVLPVYSLRRFVLRQEVELGPTNHVVYFTARTLGASLSQAGLTAVNWTNFPPPQVAVGREWSVGLKNAYARLASAIARLSSGRLVISSDLDVEAVGH